MAEEIIFILLIPILIFCLVIAGIIFWIFMLVDVIKRKFKVENDKILWLLIVILAGVLGSIIYFFMIKKENKH